ncbi:hypothetical protein RN22_13215 [Grimontia sp. AD028]|uniref:hypothetical protein n=1 Tax=Grimontia sp. AD028 TaxID=1581149 RepID=UPI00061B4BF9|nr:hypothetical protein [Grimontia sp. AD028]KKD59997.1 hypothetical protein RN22_13215 [Grimontia sp. AD028]
MFRLAAWLVLLISLSINANEVKDCGNLYSSFVDNKKRAIDFSELAEKRDVWINEHLDIYFDYEDGLNASTRVGIVKSAIIEKLQSEPSLYLDPSFIPTAIYELSRYWSYKGVDADTEEVFVNMKKGSVSFLFEDVEEHGMSTAIYVLTSGNHALIEAMYEPLGDSIFSLDALLPLYPELSGSDLREFYSCRS